MTESQESGRSGDDSTRGNGLQIDRRTALLGLVGTAGLASGGVLGYRTFLTEDEPAFADTELELTGDNLTIETVEGRVEAVTLDAGTQIDVGYTNFRETDFEDKTEDDLEEEFSVTIELAAYEDQEDTDGDPDEEGELVAFDVAIDLDDFPHHTIETELDGDETSSHDPELENGSIPLSEVDGIDDDYGVFELDDPDLGEEKTTTLEFTFEVESTTYDGNSPDNGDGWPNLSADDTVELTVTVTTVDENDLEVAIGGNVVITGDAEETPE